MDAKQLEDALIQADAAGDTEGAQILADELKKLKTAAPAEASGFDALPTWQKPLVAVDDIVRMIANGATLGYGDKFAAKMDEKTGLGADYATNLMKERSKTAEAADNSGSAGQVAKIGGTVAGAAATGIPSAL